MAATRRRWTRRRWQEPFLRPDAAVAERMIDPHFWHRVWLNLSFGDILP